MDRDHQEVLASAAAARPRLSRQITMTPAELLSLRQKENKRSLHLSTQPSKRSHLRSPFSCSTVPQYNTLHYVFLFVLTQFRVLLFIYFNSNVSVWALSKKKSSTCSRCRIAQAHNTSVTLQIGLVKIPFVDKEEKGHINILLFMTCLLCLS